MKKRMKKDKEIFETLKVKVYSSKRFRDYEAMTKKYLGGKDCSYPQKNNQGGYDYNGLRFGNLVELMVWMNRAH